MLRHALGKELMDLIVLGHERITARHGEGLQLRPSANNKALTEAIGEQGNLSRRCRAVSI